MDAGTLIPAAHQYTIRAIIQKNGNPDQRGDTRVKKGIRNFCTRHRLLTIATIVSIGILLAGTAVIMTMTILPDQPGSPGIPLPYSTTFQVSLPEGEKVSIGNLEMTALQTGEGIILKIGDRREEMVRGEEREISDRNATILLFGQPVYTTGYRLVVTWKGMDQDRAIFSITMKTSRQVPDWLISRVLPGEIQASPA